MAKVLISEAFIQLRKPHNHKLAFIEVLSKLDKEYCISATDYRDILSRYDITLTLDFVGINADSEKVKIDIIKVAQTYDIRPSVYTHKQQELKDATKTHEILSAYNRVLSQYYIKNHKYDAKIRGYKQEYNKYYNNLVEFFEANRIDDYYNFFHTLFAVSSWKQLWPLPRCVTNEALAVFQRHGRNVKQLEMNAVTVNQVVRESRWVNVFSYIEAKKKFYCGRGEYEVCMNNLEQTLGYHPKSQHCQSCPNAGSCAVRINSGFSKMTGKNVNLTDIRLGVISVEEAEKLLQPFDLYS